MAKLKQILTNKWGWSGAVIGVIITVYNYGLNKLTRLFSNTQQSVCDPLNPTECVMYIAQRFPPRMVFFVGITITLILGFIISLILEKLWRKIK